VRHDLPTGTVTFLFTDVEGSTRLLHELGPEVYGEALAEHRRVIREACAREGGVEVDTQGDAFFIAFPTAPGAIAAAYALTEALAESNVHVRVGVHTGTPLLAEEGYVGPDVHRAARIAAAGHGGQVLVSSSTAQLIELELKDLGEHRLKDLSAAERVYQLGEGEFPRLKSLYRTNLPVPTTPFLGREAELAEVTSLLASLDTRLLTLTGPGGTGKTRLAVQAAGLASDRYPEGVWWIPLASVRDPKLVLATAAQVVGSTNGLAEQIQDKEMLCLFDNFEHVVEAAADVAALLVSCPNLDVLITSREQLHVTGELEYPVQPLVHEEGVGFFLARARAARPDFTADEAVSDICRRLDELPLALELAAARAKAFSSAQILERLEQRLPLLTGGARDLPERQQTLRATIAWSYDLLSDVEQRLFARLSVFAGGCTLDAAEEVTDADPDTLQALVEKSLVRFTDDRYWMLETIREYAADRLVDSSEQRQVVASHAEHFIRLVTDAESGITGKDQESVVRVLQRDYANIRATLEYLQQRDRSRLLQCAADLWLFWRIRGNVAEGRMWLDTGLEAEKSPPGVRAEALNAAANLARLQGDFDGAAAHAEEELELAQATGDALTVSKALTNLATIASARLDIAQANARQEEAIDLLRTLEDRRPLAVGLSNLGYIALERGDARNAIVLIEESLRLHREVDDVWGESTANLNLGAAYYRSGRTDAGREAFESALRTTMRLGSMEYVAYALQGIAATISESEPQRSAELLGVSGRLLDDADAKLEPIERELREAALSRVTSLLGKNVSDALAAGAQLETSDAVERALSMD
jgi:predicted ATPase/class 3 adenylate cyclase